jgi:archaellum component FlaC
MILWLSKNTMKQQAPPDLAGTMLKRLTLQRKLMAFLISSCAAFSSLVLGWSWTINGYESMSEVTIQTIDPAFEKQQFLALLSSVIRTKVTDPLLSELLIKTKEAVPLQSRILTGDLEILRKAILVQSPPDANPIKIQFSLRGSGTKDEQIFLQEFTSDFAEELNRLSRVSAGNTRFAVQNSEFARYREVVDDLETSVQQLERKIEEVEAICGTVATETNPFRIAAHRKVSTNPSREDVIQKLQQNVSNIDLSFLHESSVELRSLLDSLASSGKPYALPEVHPIGAPQPKQLYLLLILAAAFGLVVANHFKPFAAQGFSSIAEVSGKLGIPVVATLPINQGRRDGALSESTKVRKLPWANRLTRIATGWLWGVGFLVFGFCFISQEIREIFFQNPVDGLARAFWFFKW